MSHVPTEAEVIKAFTDSPQYSQTMLLLKAAVTSAYVKNAHSKTPLPRPSAQESALRTDAKTAGILHLISETLIALGYNCSATVLSDEAGLGKTTTAPQHRDAAIKALGLKPANPSVPILYEISKPTAGAVPVTDGASPATVISKQAPAAPAPKVRQRPPPKPTETKYEISAWEDREFIRKKGEIDGQGMNIDNLTRCKVFIYDHLDSVNVDKCNDCEFIIGPTAGSVFFRGCSNTKITTACKQLRTRDCFDLDVRVFALTDPVVESSNNIKMRPFNLRMPSLKELFQKAKLDPTLNRFVHTYDFTPEDPKLPPGPHFSCIVTDSGLVMEDVRQNPSDSVECPEAIEDLLAGRIGCAESCEKKAASLDIKKGPNQAAANTAVAPTKAGVVNKASVNVSHVDPDTF